MVSRQWSASAMNGPEVGSEAAVARELGVGRRLAAPDPPLPVRLHERGEGRPRARLRHQLELFSMMLRKSPHRVSTRILGTDSTHEALDLLAAAGWIVPLRAQREMQFIAKFLRNPTHLLGIVDDARRDGD